MGLLSFQRQLTRKRSRAGLQTKSTQHGMQPMLPPEGEHQCEAPGRRQVEWSKPREGAALSIPILGSKAEHDRAARIF